MFGLVHGRKVVGYSLLHPQEPRVIVFHGDEISALGASLSAAAGKERSRFDVLSKSDLVENVEALTKNIPTMNPMTAAKFQPRLDFGKYVLKIFEGNQTGNTLPAITTLPMASDGIVFEPDISEEDKAEALLALSLYDKHKAAEWLDEHKAELLSYDFNGFSIFDGELSVSLTERGKNGHSKDVDVFLEELVGIQDSFLAAKSIFKLAHPERSHNPYSYFADVSPQLVMVLGYFKDKPQEAKRFADAVCALSGEWTVDPTVYKDEGGNPLLKLDIDCEREQFSLFLSPEEIEKFLHDLHGLEEFLGQGTYRKVVSRSFNVAVGVVNHAIAMVRSGSIGFEPSPVASPSMPLDCAFSLS